MKKYSLHLLSLFFILIITGCVPQQKCDLASMKNSLTQEEKKKIYSTIQAEINTLLDISDSYYAKTYYLDALKGYTLINFYNDNQIISQDKINRLIKRIEANRKHYYKKATSKKFAQNKKKKLFYLNELMRNDPVYKDGKTLYNELREDSEIVEFLKADKEKLEELLKIESNDEKYIKELNSSLSKVAKYDDMEPLVIQAKEVLKKKRYILQENAKKLYKGQKINLAKNKFIFIRSIYKKDRTANKYLYLISKNSKLHSMEKKALTALEKSNYKEAITLANQMLSFNNKNSKALNIFKKANQELKKQIPKMIKKATIYYSKQDYDKALNLFKEILKFDSTNNTALTYTKKIKAQLKTIQSLQGI